MASCSDAVIRTAFSEESGVLREIHRRASYIWVEDRPNLDAHPEIFGVDRRSLADGRVRVAIGASDEILGFATWRPTSDDDAELDDLFVEPDAMRRGIGRALVEDAADQARHAGRSCLLVVAHQRTLSFYERAGFEQKGAADTRFGPALRLARAL